jgi:hypothetical protein
LRQQQCQEIGPPMQIADGIDADFPRHTRRPPIAAQRGSLPHDRLSPDF